jgi:hypothetical protein
MKTGSGSPSLVAGLLGLAGCLTKPAHAAELRKQIEAAEAAFAAAASKADSAALGSLYNQDAQVMPTGREPIHGRQAILQFWRMALQSVSPKSTCRRWRSLALVLPPPKSDTTSYMIKPALGSTAANTSSSGAGRMVTGNFTATCSRPTCRLPGGSPGCA